MNKVFWPSYCILVLLIPLTINCAIPPHSKRASHSTNTRKRKSPEPADPSEPTNISQTTDLQENPLPFGATSITNPVYFLGNLYYFQLTESKWTDPSTYVLRYQFFALNKDGTAYETEKLISLTLKNLDQCPARITIQCKHQNPNDLNLLENHEWDSRPKMYAKFDEIITEELSREFYLLCCINPIETEGILACCQPGSCNGKGSTRKGGASSFHLENNILTIYASFVVLKCGHFFHQKCLPENFKKNIIICPACKTLIRPPDDFFICKKILPQIRINKL